MSYQRLKLERVTLIKLMTSMSYQKLKLDIVTLMKRLAIR